MIYTVTFNPAIDYVVRLDAPLEVGQVNRACGEDCVLGGKGINVSKVVAALGGQTVACGLLGGAAGHVRVLHAHGHGRFSLSGGLGSHVAGRGLGGRAGLRGGRARGGRRGCQGFRFGGAGCERKSADQQRRGL